MKKITFEDIKTKFSAYAEYIDSYNFKLKNGFIFYKDGTITLDITDGGGDKKFHAIWVVIAEKRTPKQMKVFIESLI